MKLAGILLLLATGAAAQNLRLAAPVASGFTGAYVGTVQFSLTQEPLYASMLLNGFSRHLQTVLPMRNASDVKRYLEAAVADSPRAMDSLKASMGQAPLEARRASALLLANGLARPEQFRDIVESLEGVKPGLGKQVTRLLKESNSSGAHPDFVRLLRTLGEASVPVGKPFIYDSKGRLERLFDGTPLRRDDESSLLPAQPVRTGGYTGYGPDGKPRRNALLPAPKK